MPCSCCGSYFYTEYAECGDLRICRRCVRDLAEQLGVCGNADHFAPYSMYALTNPEPEPGEGSESA
jgi:hypothetical protein